MSEPKAFYERTVQERLQEVVDLLPVFSDDPAKRARRTTMFHIVDDGQTVLLEDFLQDDSLNAPPTGIAYFPRELMRGVITKGEISYCSRYNWQVARATHHARWIVTVVSGSNFRQATPETVAALVSEYPDSRIRAELIKRLITSPQDSRGEMVDIHSFLNFIHTTHVELNGRTYYGHEPSILVI